MITVDEAIALDRWIGEGASPAEIEQRIGEVKERLFAGKSAEETAEINKVLNEADAKLEAGAKEARANVVAVATTPTAVATTIAPAAPPSRKTRPWRSTEEEFGEERRNIRADLDRMFADASTPFFDSSDERKRKVEGEISGGLAQLAARRKRP